VVRSLFGKTGRPRRRVSAKHLGMRFFTQSMMAADCQIAAGLTRPSIFNIKCPSMRLQMQFADKDSGSFLLPIVQVMFFTIVLMIMGCVSAPTDVKMESKFLAKQLGVPGCRVSVPLSEAQVVEDAKRMGNSHPENNQEWIAITKSIKVGDQLRAVNCLSSKSTYYYVLIRDGVITQRFYSSIFD